MTTVALFPMRIILYLKNKFIMPKYVSKPIEPVCHRKKCIHALFEIQAQWRPNDTALIFRHQSVTYEALNAKANQLAHFLLGHGVKPDTLVGICMDRSPEMMIALLGILKAGGAYVPLDPAYPKDRLNFMVEDTQAPLILVQHHLKKHFPLSVNVIIYEEMIENLQNFPSDNPKVPANPDQLAYVIYTSGSTGKPKGVAIPHRGVTRLIFENDYAPFGSDQVYLQLAPITFDASTFEIWGALLHGASCVLYPDQIPEFGTLSSVINRHGITCLWLTAALFNLIIDERPETLANVPTILTGGEALSVAHIKKAQTLLPKSQLVNGYGPTESTTFTCCYQIPDIKNLSLASIPIGQPIGNTEVYILDENLCPVAASEAGELYVGGDGLARGYLNRPELTKKCFIKNPFSEDPASRLYKTGDVCRHLPDGNIEYINRIDFQVKIRGFRIELGEIEAALNDHTDVLQSMVLVREDAPGLKYLSGYVVSRRDGTFDSDGILSFLSKKLPAYMIPSAIVPLDHLPLTPNGKLDRKSVPDLHALGSSSPMFISPQTETERKLAGIWSELLNVEKINVLDNFFALGGNSLLIIRCAFQIHERLGAQIPLELLFSKPILKDLAFDIDRALTTEQQVMPTLSRNTDLPPSFSQRRLWFLNEYYPDSPLYNVPFSMNIIGHLDIEALQKSVSCIVNRHEGLKTTFVYEHDKLLQIINQSKNIELNKIQIKGNATCNKETLDNLIIKSASTPFNMKKGPLYRFDLFISNTSHHTLLVNMHHSITDGWSTGIFFKEMAAAYNQYHRHQTPCFAPLKLQYADYANWQQTQLEHILDKDYAYWKNKINQEGQPLNLPYDFPLKNNLAYDGAWETMRVESDLSESLAKACTKKKCTAYMLLLTVLKIQLQRITLQNDISIGSPIANRKHQNFSGVIGFFVNTIILRSRLSEDFTFNQCLDLIKKECIDAQAHQDVPFDLLVEKLNPERRTGRNPFFNVMFSLQDNTQWQVNLVDLKTTINEISTDTSKFDLLFFAEEHDSGLSLRAEYNTDLFKQTTIQKILRDYKGILKQVIDNPNTKISAISISDFARSHLNPNKNNESQRALKSSAENSKTEVGRSLPTETEKSLIDIWSELLHLDNVDLTDNFFSLGGNSLLAMRMTYQIEKKMDCHLPLSVLFESPTIHELAKQIETQQHDLITKNIVTIKKGGGKYPVFYLPGGGGHVLSFYHLTAEMKLDCPEYGLNLPGLDKITPVCTSIEDMADFFLDIIKTVQPHGPYFLCGYSIGGRVAYEMACRLQDQGQEIGFLGLIGATAPGYPRNSSKKWKRIYYRIQDFLSLSMKLKIEYVRIRQKLKKIRKQKKIAKQKGMHENKRLMFSEKVMQASLQAYYGYKTNHLFKGPAVLIKEQKGWDLLYANYDDPLYGWGKYIEGEIQVHSIACEHLELFNQPHVRQLGKILEHEISKSFQNKASHN